MVSYILGTAGHIDHGKSALIRELTGIDPDRLVEEKKRGITIELGFAQLPLADGTILGVVDVPGHEKFVRQMVAGASGVDIALLIVAADDGVMVQTREHVRVLQLMGIKHMVVALTKSDLADQEWRELVATDIEELLAAHGFEGVPIIETSVVSGSGIDKLKAQLKTVVHGIGKKQASEIMRLPVDRVFTIEGSGCVVTGTLWSGVAHIGDMVELLPSRQEARIRGIQVHGTAQESAQAGQRVALNLAGISATDVARGETVATPGSTAMTNRFDVALHYLGPDEGDVPLKSGARVHVHHAAATTLGRVLFFEDAPLASDTQAFAQIRLESPIAARYGDRFIIRSYSPTFTIGGGMILIPHAQKRAVLRAGESDLLTALHAGDIEAAVTGLMTMTDAAHTSADLALALGAPRSQVAAALNQGDFERIKMGKETAFITPEGAQHIRRVLDRTLLAFHESNPRETDMSVATLREQATPDLESALFDFYLDQLVQQKTVGISGGRVRHNHAAQTAALEQEELRERALPLLATARLSPDSIADLSIRLEADRKTLERALAPLVSGGTLIRLAGDLYFTAEAIEAGADTIRASLGGMPEGATAAQLRDTLGVSRKYAIPLLEYYDRTAVTRREGDVRFLR